VPACHLAELDPGLSVRVNHITSNVWLALFSVNKDAILPTGSDPILPDVWHAAGVLIVTDNLDTVFMRLFYQVFNNIGFVVQNFDANIVQTHLILNDLESFRIKFIT
jgi:hypothetical protein